MEKTQLDADVNTLALAYDDIKDKKSKYQIALFCRDLKHDQNIDLDEAELETVDNMIFKEGLIDDDEDIIVEKFPTEVPEQDSEEEHELTKQVNRLMAFDSTAYEVYGDAREKAFTPRSALGRALGRETVEKMHDRQKNGHPLDR